MKTTAIASLIVSAAVQQQRAARASTASLVLADEGQPLVLVVSAAVQQQRAARASTASLVLADEV